jgi:hypothetical protein
VNPITDSQTVQVPTCTGSLGRETNSKFCLRNTALLVVCRTCAVINCKCCVLCLVKCFVQKNCVYCIFILPRKYLIHRDTFCYVCGEITFRFQRRNLILLIIKCYELNFGCKVGDKNKSCTPHICNVKCVRLLTGWVKGSRQMPFTIPMVWREPRDYSSDDYFCLTNITAMTSKSKYTVKYPDVPSAMTPVPHSGEFSCNNVSGKSDF